MEGIIVIGHGSRNPDTNSFFKNFITNIDNQNNLEVVDAYLEFHENTLENRVNYFYEKNISKILVVPYFLFGGKHVDKHIPNMIDTLKTKYLDLDIKLESPLSYDPLITKIIQNKIDYNSL